MGYIILNFARLTKCHYFARNDRIRKDRILNRLHLLEKNIKAISLQDPKLAAWVTEKPPDSTIKIVSDQDGLSNLYITRPGDSPVPYYPELPSIEKETGHIESMDLSAGSMTCLIGIGLGFTAQAILNKMEQGHILVVIEPNPDILRTAFETFDFSDSIAKGYLYVLIPETTEVEDRLLELISGGFASKNLKIVADPRSVHLFPEYEEWVNRIRISFYYITDIVSGTTKVAKDIFLNEVKNLEHTVTSPGLDVLKRFVQGMPMMIIGAGPSLDDSFDDIRKTMNKVVTVAFSACWRTLLENGINPDFVVFSDKNKEGYASFKNTESAQKETILICASCAFPDAIDEYKGNKFVVPDSGGIRKLIHPFLENRPHFYPGFSVANFAVRIASYLEADPVILIGLDLALGKYSHSKGHPFSAPIQEDPDAPIVEGVKGTRVRNAKHLGNIRNLIEKDIEGMRATVVNATLSGAHIRGTVERYLSEVDNTLQPLSVDFKAVRKAEFVVKPETLSSISNILADTAQQIQITTENCDRGLEAARELKSSSPGSSRDKLRLRTNQLTAKVEKTLEEILFLKRLLGDLLHETKVINAAIAIEKDGDKRFDMGVNKNIYALSVVNERLSELIQLLKQNEDKCKRIAKSLT